MVGEGRKRRKRRVEDVLLERGFCEEAMLSDLTNNV